MPSLRHVFTKTSVRPLYTRGAFGDARCSSPCNCSLVLRVSGTLDIETAAQPARPPHMNDSARLRGVGTGLDGFGSVTGLVLTDPADDTAWADMVTECRGGCFDNKGERLE